MKILLMNPWFSEISDTISEKTPDIFKTNNYEEALRIVMEKAVTHACIIGGGYNYSKASCNTVSGRQAAREFHEINPKMKLLVWNGVETDEPIKTEDSKTFLDSNNFGDEIFDITESFFKESTV